MADCGESLNIWPKYWWKWHGRNTGNKGNSGYRGHY